MPSFEPIIESSQLPAVDDGYERAVFDLKSTASPQPGFHHAKDVAAFANHLGGTLLIGAQETNGRVGVYVPLPEDLVNRIQSAFSQSVRDRCSPRPLIDFARFAFGDRFVLAVNVWPYVGQVVGVAVKCKKEHDGCGEDAHVFPVRIGVDASYLLPEQLPMFMTPEIRRAAILLSKIPANSEVQVKVGLRHENLRNFAGNIVEVDEQKNRFVVDVYADGGSTRRKREWLPIDQVRTVFEKQGGAWVIAVRDFE